MKKVYGVSLGALIALIMFACSNEGAPKGKSGNVDEGERAVLHGDYYHFESEAELAANADLIVKGKVQSTKEELIDIAGKPNGENLEGE